MLDLLRPRRLSVLFVAVLAGLGSLAASAATGPLEPLGSDRPLPDGALPTALWADVADGRAYLRTVDGVVAADLESGAEVGRVRMDPPPWHAGHGSVLQGFASRREHTAALDVHGDRLFVPYGITSRDGEDWLPFAALSWGFSASQDPAGTAERLAAPPRQQVEEGRPCVSMSHVMYGGDCVAGVHVLDTATMRVAASIPVRQAGPDGALIAPILRTTVWSPGPDGGKVHLVVEDLGHHADANWVFNQNQTRSLGQASLHWIIQLDPDTGAQDWMVPVPACRGTRDRVEYAQEANETTHQPHPVALHRDSAGGVLYVACAAPGDSRPGVLVRIPLDAAGRPDGTGLLPGEWAETLLPDGVLEFRMDAAAGRLVVRHQPSRCNLYTSPLLGCPPHQEVWTAWELATGAPGGEWQVGQIRSTDVAATLDPASGAVVLHIVDLDGARFARFSSRTTGSSVSWGPAPVPDPRALVTLAAEPGPGHSKTRISLLTGDRWHRFRQVSHD